MDPERQLYYDVANAARPCFNADWADMVDGDLAVGEEYMAVDGAMQRASMENYPLPHSLLLRIRPLIERNLTHRKRTLGFLDKLLALPDPEVTHRETTE